MTFVKLYIKIKILKNSFSFNLKKMNEINIQFEDFKLMNQMPKLYLANYFEELKIEVDLEN